MIVEIDLVSANECGHPENNKEPSFREQSRRNNSVAPLLSLLAAMNFPFVAVPRPARFA